MATGLLRRHHGRRKPGALLGSWVPRAYEARCGRPFPPVQTAENLARGSHRRRGPPCPACVTGRPAFCRWPTGATNRKRSMTCSPPAEVDAWDAITVTRDEHRPGPDAVLDPARPTAPSCIGTGTGETGGVRRSGCAAAGRYSWRRPVATTRRTSASPNGDAPCAEARAALVTLVDTPAVNCRALRRRPRWPARSFGHCRAWTGLSVPDRFLRDGSRLWRCRFGASSRRRRSSVWRTAGVAAAAGGASSSATARRTALRRWPGSRASQRWLWREAGAVDLVAGEGTDLPGRVADVISSALGRWRLTSRALTCWSPGSRATRGRPIPVRELIGDPETYAAQRELVDRLAQGRLLIPVLANLDEKDPEGGDKHSHMATVTITDAQGHKALDDLHRGRLGGHVARGCPTHSGWPAWRRHRPLWGKAVMRC